MGIYQNFLCLKLKEKNLNLICYDCLQANYIYPNPSLKSLADTATPSDQTLQYPTPSTSEHEVAPISPIATSTEASPAAEAPQVPQFPMSTEAPQVAEASLVSLIPTLIPHQPGMLNPPSLWSLDESLSRLEDSCCQSVSSIRRSSTSQLRWKHCQG